jgi:hypothetical protein
MTKAGTTRHRYDAAEFALWLSPHTLANTGRVLATVVKRLIQRSMSTCRCWRRWPGVRWRCHRPPQTAWDCADWEDNRILDLAAAVGAFLIVSADVDLTTMSP